MSEAAEERQPLLRPSAAVEGPFLVLGKCLLWLSGWRLILVLVLAFFVHLFREKQVTEWFLLLHTTMQTDVLFSMGATLALTATALFAASVCSDDGTISESILCFPFVVAASATTVWSAFLRISQAHELKITHIKHHSTEESDHEAKPMLDGIAELWAWVPTELFGLLKQTLARPWKYSLGIEEDHQETYSIAQWRELIIGGAFWFSLLVGLMVAPGIQRTIPDRRFQGCWLALWLAVFLIAVGTFMSVVVTTEPLMRFWVFLIRPFRRIWLHLGFQNDDSKANGQGLVALQPEDRIAFLFVLWFFARLAFLSVRARLEQWAARQKCEEGLRYALARPFRADLESGFASTTSSSLSTGTLLPSSGLGPLDAAARGVLLTAAGAWKSKESSEKTLASSDSEGAPESQSSKNTLSNPPKDVQLGSADEPSGISLRGILSIAEKRLMLVAARREALSAEACGEAALPTSLSLKVKRSTLLQDTWFEMVERPVSELLAPSVTVDFDGEEGIDSGGLTRDWFDSVARTVAEGAYKSNGLVALAPDGTLMPRSVALRGGAEATEEEVDQMRSLLALGRFLALAVFFGRPLPLALSLVVCKYILRCPVSMDDVRRLDPEFYRGRVEAVLRPGGLAELSAALGAPLTFTAAPSDWRALPDTGDDDAEVVEELTPGGADTEVTEENKVEYVRLLCEAYLCGGVRREIQCILQGFWDVLPLELLKELEVGPGELSILISGAHDVDADDWRENSIPSGDQRVIDWFWQVVRDELKAEERCLLLQFATGSSRLPLGGFQDLQPLFSIEISNGASPEHLPHAHTCINNLVLPRYRTKRQLLTKLRLALGAEGFGFS